MIVGMKLQLHAVEAKREFVSWKKKHKKALGWDK